MPKTLGTETLDFTKVRSIDAFTVSIRAAGDQLDVYPLLERVSNSDESIIETLQMSPGRFSEAEMRAILDQDTAVIAELPNYDTLRTGLAKLMHALLDTRG
jgi:hypothetical protein